MTAKEEFIEKFKTRTKSFGLEAVKEADEVVFWIEVLMESGIYNNTQIQNFAREGGEILAVLSTARKNT